MSVRESARPRPARRTAACLTAAIALLGLAATACSTAGGSSGSNHAVAPELAADSVPGSSTSGIRKIQHVVVIMQENRSFDSYFGTYPGADGIPVSNGQFSVCVPDPAAGTCLKPFHNPADKNSGGPHGADHAAADIDSGKMDGFVDQAEAGSKVCKDPNNPACTDGGATDVMGYHDAREIPNYWSYAQNFVLQDHMFEPNSSWSLPSHLFTVSEWSAKCSKPGDPMSCINELDHPDLPPDFLPAQFGKVVKRPDFAWTDLTYLLHQNHVSWKYYVAEGTEPDCEDDQATCVAKPQKAGTPGIWNPLPWFDTVHQDGEIGNIQAIDRLLSGREGRNAPGGLVGVAEPGGERTPTGADQRRARPT